MDKEKREKEGAERLNVADEQLKQDGKRLQDIREAEKASLNVKKLQHQPDEDTRKLFTARKAIEQESNKTVAEALQNTSSR
jgi:hypothetical protein